MKLNLSLRKIDGCIAVSFFFMLSPIYWGLYSGKLHLKDHLNHFADMLAVLAALYAGRTVFFAPSNVPTESVRRAGALKKESSTTTTPVSVATKTSSTSESAYQGIKDSPVTTNPDADNDLTDKATRETPEEVFVVMCAFLFVYAIIKGATYLELVADGQLWLLIILMNLAAGSFVSIAFARALDDKKVVKLRVILALAFSLTSLALSGLAIYSR